MVTCYIKKIYFCYGLLLFHDLFVKASKYSPVEILEHPKSYEQLVVEMENYKIAMHTFARAWDNFIV